VRGRNIANEDFSFSLSLIDYFLLSFIDSFFLFCYFFRTEWRLEYSAKNEYQLSDLSAKSWSNFIDRMTQDNSLFTRWWLNFRTKMPSLPCDALCKRAQFCQLRYADPISIIKCLGHGKRRRR
jgi:hypothetical protein